MYYNRLNEAEKIGKELGRIIIRFKYYSPLQKISFFCFMFLIIGIPYYFIFYNLKGSRKFLRGI
mgnify:CR=1 FL=1|jgi:hypothetical protein